MYTVLDPSEYEPLPSDQELAGNDYILGALDRDERTICLYGGSGSGKTFSAIQWAVDQMEMFHPEFGRRGWQCSLCRRLRTNAKDDLWEPLLLQLEIEGILDYCEVNKTDLVVRYCPNSGDKYPVFNGIRVKGLDNPEKIKGKDMIWIVDEANQITEDMYLQMLNRSGRAKGTHAKVVLMWNPVSKTSWLYHYFGFDTGNPPPNVYIQHSTYADNEENLDPTYVQQLLSYQGLMRDIYTLGKWGTAEGLIYPDTMWRVEEVGDLLNTTGYTCIGIDWGYNNPTAVVGIRIVSPSVQTAMRPVCIVDQLFYKSGTTAADVAEYLRNQHITDSVPIYCDSARPESIEDLRRYGFDAKPASKRVFDGISYVQGCYLILTARSEAIQREITGYSWDRTPDGQWIDEPLKCADHAMDAIRYGIYTHHQQAPDLFAVPEIVRMSSRGVAYWPAAN